MKVKILNLKRNSEFKMIYLHSVAELVKKEVINTAANRTIFQDTFVL